MTIFPLNFSFKLSFKLKLSYEPNEFKTKFWFI